MTTPTTLDTYIIGALERLAETEAHAARQARAANLPDDAKYFQRAANAYARALCHFLAGVRPTETPNGWVLPSQRAGEAPHKLHKDGTWVCSCPSGEHIHWASALIIGIEVAEDDMERLDDGDDEEPPPGIQVEATPGGITLSRDGERYTAIGPNGLGVLIRQLATPAATPTQLGQRLARERARAARY